MAARADAVGRAGRNGPGPADDEAAQRLLPSSGGGIEMMSFGTDPFSGGAARRRARVLERLESMDPESQGRIDKQKLVDLVDDVIESEASRKTARVSMLLAAAFAVALLGGIFFLTWSIVGRLHAHVDRLSEHVNALSMGGGGSGSASAYVPAMRPSIVLTGVTRFIRTKAPESAAKQAGGRHWYGVARAVSTSSSGGGAGSGAAQLFPVHYVYAYSGANVTADQLATICSAVELGELDVAVKFQGGVTEGGTPADSTSGVVESPPKQLKPPLTLQKATVSDASLCEDPNRAAGALGLVMRRAGDDVPWSSITIDAKVTCTAGADKVCSFTGETMLDTVDSFQCIDKQNSTVVWSCPDLSNSRYGGPEPPVTEAQVSRMCGAVAGTCSRNVSRLGEMADMGWMPMNGIDMHIEPTDSCVLFNASSLQCLRCKMTCPSACVHADAPPDETCKEEPQTLGCDTCTLGATCARQQCGETCIPAHTKVTVRSQAEDPAGFHRLRPCCDSTAGVPWSLQSDAGAPQGEKRCYPAR